MSEEQKKETAENEAENKETTTDDSAEKAEAGVDNEPKKETDSSEKKEAANASDKEKTTEPPSKESEEETPPSINVPSDDDTSEVEVKEEIKTFDIEPGYTVRVHQKIKEVNAKGEEKERIQVFEGMVLGVRKPKSPVGTFTVRKISNGVGVEKIFPINSPNIDKIEVLKKAKVSKAKLYFLRRYRKRLKEKKVV